MILLLLLAVVLVLPAGGSAADKWQLTTDPGVRLRDVVSSEVLRLPDGSATRLKVRSLVGLLPLCATTIVEPWQRQRVPKVGSMPIDSVPRPAFDEISSTVPASMRSSASRISWL